MRIPEILKPALGAARTNIRPGIALWVVAVAILALYTFQPDVRSALESLSVLKQRTGLFFALVGTSLAGGLIPWLVLRIQSATRDRAPVRHLPFFILYWAFKGVEIDCLYRLQAWIFGQGNEWSVLIPKVLCDQLVYLTLWGAPTMVLALKWKDLEYDFRKTRALLDRHFYARQVLPIIIANWAVWTPAVAVIYSLPLPLQLPMQNLVLCLWVLILTVMMKAPVPAAAH